MPTNRADTRTDKKIGGLAHRRRRTLRTLGAIWGAGLLSLVIGGLFALSGAGDALEVRNPPPPLVEFSSRIAPVDPAAPGPTPAGVDAAFADVLRSPDLGRLTGIVSDVGSGAILWSRDESAPMVPASTTKLLTATAALLTLPADHTVATTVVAGSRPGEVVLVGSGDPTLTARPIGTDGYYRGAAHVAQLADAIRAAGVPVDTVLVDNAAYTGDTAAPGWDTRDIADGNFAPIEPVMLEGGRLRIDEDDPPRTPTPSLDAGRALATELGADPAVVAFGSAPPGAAELASVRSAPLRDRLGQMMRSSDNVLAETIGREVALASGRPASFAGAVDAVTEALATHGFDTTGLTLHDTSGLSVDGRLPAALLDATVARAAGPDTPQLRPLLDTLPIAGVSGTLSDRYVASSRSGAGWVRAKTGSLTDVTALAGYVVDTDGRVLAFSFLSNGTPPGVARPAVDSLAAALRSCGCR